MPSTAARVMGKVSRKDQAWGQKRGGVRIMGSLVDCPSSQIGCTTSAIRADPPLRASNGSRRSRCRTYGEGKEAGAVDEKSGAGSSHAMQSTHHASTPAHILTRALLWWPVKRQSNAKSVISREEKALQYSGEQGSTTDSQKWRIGVCHERRGQREGGVVKKEPGRQAEDTDPTPPSLTCQASFSGFMAPPSVCLSPGNRLRSACQQQNAAAAAVRSRSVSAAAA